MAEIETLGILDEIQSLVSDKLQVVSYKWLSRNFLVSSNDAKRLLHDFVEKHGTGIQIVYSLSGWLKSDPSVYHISLVSKPKLAEARKEFDDNCSVQIYSVQACLPKDPAVLWNAEFVQAEELFKQPHAVDNCLLDNRFCGVSNSFVKRNAGGTQGSTTVLQVKSKGVSEASRNTLPNQSPTLLQPQQKRVQDSSPNTRLQSTEVVKDAKSDSNITGIREQSSKPAGDKEKFTQPVNKKKVLPDKNSSGTGGALANMWGRASTKSKAECASTRTTSVLDSSDAQIYALEAVNHESSDDEGQGVNIKRSWNGESSRKRRVVFDYSDEEDEYKDAVNLASPDPPKKQSVLDPEQSSHPKDLEKNKLNFEEEKEEKTKGEDGKEADRKTNQILKEECLALRKSSNIKASSLEKHINHIPAVDTIVKDKLTNAAPQSPKRRKVLKTRIDERGREVTEVVWEGEETDAKPDSNAVKKVDIVPASNTANRQSTVKKSPAVATNAPLKEVGKGGNKKAGNKDPKQGNILSFFKKV